MPRGRRAGNTPECRDEDSRKVRRPDLLEKELFNHPVLRCEPEYYAAEPCPEGSWKLVQGSPGQVTRFWVCAHAAALQSPSHWALPQAQCSPCTGRGSARRPSLCTAPGIAWLHTAPFACWTRFTSNWRRQGGPRRTSGRPLSATGVEGAAGPDLADRPSGARRVLG